MTIFSQEKQYELPLVPHYFDFVQNRIQLFIRLYEHKDDLRKANEKGFSVMVSKRMTYDQVKYIGEISLCIFMFSSYSMISGRRKDCSPHEARSYEVAVLGVPHGRRLPQECGSAQRKPDALRNDAEFVLC